MQGRRLAASDNWRELAKDFRALAAERDYTFLWAVRTAVDRDGIEWKIDGNYSFQNRFRALAARAARELSPSAVDLLESWLEALRIENPHVLHREELPSPLRWPEGEIKRTSERFSYLCEASSDFCSTLEANAIENEQAERFAEQWQSDRKNWSPLRQQWEAFKEIRLLETGPREKIPEAFIRTVPSQQYGVKPEDVTPRQIQSEILSLLPDYHAVEIVPASQPLATTEAASEPSANVPAAPAQETTKAQTIREQINRLRDECHWTAEELSEKVKMSTRSVQRHLAGDSIPYGRHLRTYEAVFAKELKRTVHISKMS
jgi:hypothetical protein